MGQKKGCKKPAGSGRKLGIPNKRTGYSVSARLNDLGYDIVEKILTDIGLISSPEYRVKAHFQLLEYCDAKRKAIEMTQNISELSDKTILEKIELGKAAIRFLEEQTNIENDDD